jgi:cytochrome oxidase assembly protein ShyY1
MRDGKAGVELLQPFHDQASGQWLLVNRGWLPWPDRRVPVQFVTPDQALDWTPGSMSRPARPSSCTPTPPAASGRIC